MLRGIDFAFGSGLTSQQIKKAGFEFTGRYLSGGEPKDITAPEIKADLDAGLQTIFFWETTGVDMTSRANGQSDAGKAQYELDQLANILVRQDLAMAPVFFAADAASESDETGYLEGTASVIGHTRNALYGGFATMRAAFDRGLISYGCQTYAWSNGHWDDRAILRQVLNGISVGPATCDLEEAAYWNSAKVLTAADDFGQWPRPDVPPPPSTQGAYRHILGSLETIGAFAAQRGIGAERLVTFSLEHYDQADWHRLAEHGRGRIAVYTDRP